MKTILLAGALIFGPRIESQTATREYRVTNASRSYDFLVRVREHKWQGTNEYCEGPGSVLIFRKGTSQSIQTINMKNILLRCDKRRALVNTAPLYDDQGLINVGDFNFDGHEDFAIQNGNEGSYGQASYSVFLYSPSKSNFVFSKPLSSLIEGSLGFFDVDRKHNRLVTFSKSGCCYHETVEYAVKDNKPVPVARTIEDATAAPDGFEDVRRERYVNGKWKQTSIERIALPRDEGK